jgi:hypothetical protein
LADGIWLISFMEYNPPFFDEVGSATNPFVPER